MVTKKLKIEQQVHSKQIFQTTDIKDLQGVVLSSDAERTRLAIQEEYLDPYKLEMPAYVLKQLVMASQEADLNKASEHLQKARQKAHTHYLSKWATGVIRVKDDDAPPMPDAVKAQLRELNEKRREERRIDKEAANARKRELDKADHVETVRSTVTKKGKKPVFDDPDAQKLVLTKYPWAVANTFKQDQNKPGGTNLDIRCQVCGRHRTVHLADVFQVRYCNGCRKTNAKTGPKQPEMG
jgi:ribosomal protein S27E